VYVWICAQSSADPWQRGAPPPPDDPRLAAGPWEPRGLNPGVVQRQLRSVIRVDDELSVVAWLYVGVSAEEETKTAGLSVVNGISVA
jgi:hypothetical protein